MHFTNVVGHEFEKEALIRAVREGRVSHAYLFSGPEGVGKKLFAKEFAKLLNCSAPPATAGEEDGKSGGDKAECDCNSCSKIARGIHPDVFTVEYKGVKDIKVEQIREEVEERVQGRPFEGNYKVAVVNDAHRMNKNAQNAFLKTLEEPPSNTVIILITSEPEALLPTIRSRCQRLEFSPLPNSLVTEQLVILAGLDRKDAQAAAKLARGSLGRAQRLDSEMLAFRKEVIEELADVRAESAAQVLGFAKNIPLKSSSKRDQEKLELLFEIIASLLEDIIFLKTSGSGEEGGEGGEEAGLPDGKIINSDVLPVLRRLAHRMSLESVIEKIGEFERTRRAVFNANANKQLAIESIVITLGENHNPL